MALPAPNHQDTCSECGASLSAAMRNCPTCRADAGAPNVRRCRRDENLKALAARVDTSRARANTIGCSKEFGDFEAILKGKSGVVVSMTAGIARKLIEDPNSLYANYDQLVGATIRKPANFDNDRHRCAVGGLLFGSYSSYIIYGALSLTENGVPTYGPVHCRLRSVAIAKRTSFLETNSYKFVLDHDPIADDKWLIGYTACWKHRHSLVLSKLADRLSTGQTESDWQDLLIYSNGQNREDDDFVEAHIYEGFDKNAVESMVASTGKKLSKAEKLDCDIAISEFNRLAGITK